MIVVCVLMFCFVYMCKYIIYLCYICYKLLVFKIKKIFWKNIYKKILFMINFIRIKLNCLWFKVFCIKDKVINRVFYLFYVFIYDWELGYLL